MIRGLKPPALAICFVVAGTIGYAAPASAQATRTWVSGVGDDVNPCSRTAPCKTFAGAISKTATGGEINCLDPAGYGTVTITKSITIDCTGTFGSVLNSGGINGIIVNDGAGSTPGTAKVILRGLSINGAGTTPGLNGVRFMSGASLFVEDVIIQNQAGFGISFEPSGFAKLFVKHASILNGADNVAGGVLVQPTGSGSSRSTLEEVQIVNTTGDAVQVNTTGNSGGGNTLHIRDSQIAENGQGIAVLTPTGTSTAVVTVSGTNITANNGNGIATQGAGVQVRVERSNISNNIGGIFISQNATVASYGDNRLYGNLTDGAFSTVLPSQ